MIIDGEYIKTDKKLNVYSPYNNEVVGEVYIATQEIIDSAIKTTVNYNNDFCKDDRKKLLEKVANYIKEHSLELAKLISSESGLSLQDTIHETHRVENVFRYAAKSVDIIEKDVSETFLIGDESGFNLKVVSEPVKAVLAITPFNHPMNQVAHKIAPAIVANAPVLLKPSEKTPLSAIKLVEILHKCGLPKGMINVLTVENPGEFLEIALKSRKFEVVTFTGGVFIGKLIAKKIVETGNELIKYIPELGGNPAITILDDADIDVAVKSSLNAYANSGQRCTAIKRILLHNDIADKFIKKFLEATRAIKYGNPYNENVNMGTVIDEEAAKHIQDKVNNAINDGAKLLYGNIREGALYSPTLLDFVNPKSDLVVTETFGPVAPIIRINSIDQAIDIINSVPYKLAGAAITQDKSKAEKIANAIHVGQFSWNNNPGFRTEAAPFGGFGDSGNGEKEGVIMAAHGLRKIRTFYEHAV